MDDVTREDAPAPEIDTSRPHPARIYDYTLGGKNHFAADREVADQALAAWPSARVTARENRAFLGRAVKWLVTEVGVRQFLDIGTGLPTTDNTHEVAQRMAPECRVVYADNDPLVLAHARALLTSSPEGRTAYVQADLRDPESILSAPETRELLDFSQPVALMLLAVLHFVPDEADPAGVVRTLVDRLPAGSYLTATHVTSEHNRAETDAALRTNRNAGIPLGARDSDVFARLAFSGLDLIPPGVVLVSDWKPETVGSRPLPSEVSLYGGVARKP